MFINIQHKVPVVAFLIKNNRLADLLTVLFKKCFDLGITPDIWKQSIISPVPKVQATR